tara:strand:+ start:304 stop:1062 length:759 start_codon:yes stop_codon:yes gene_type:complete
MINFKLYFEVLQYGPTTGKNKDAWSEDFVNLVKSMRENPDEYSSIVTQTDIADHLMKHKYKEADLRGPITQRLVSFLEEWPAVTKHFVTDDNPDGSLRRMKWYSRTVGTRTVDKKTSFIEGGGAKVNTKPVQQKVRNKGVRIAALDDNRADHGGLHTCVMCKLQPRIFYNFNEKSAMRVLYAHHLRQMREEDDPEKGRVTYVKKDIAVLCGNCHVIADTKARKNYSLRGVKVLGVDDTADVNDTALQVPAVQ